MDNTKNGYRGLDGPSSAKCMPQHRFRRTDRQLVGVVAKTGFDSLGLRGIVETCRCPMCVDVIHLLGTQPGAL